MAVRKFSASMDERTLRQARGVARQEGVSFSAWLAEATRDRLRLRGLRRQIAEFEAEYGEISREEVAEVRREVRAARSRRRQRSG